VEVTTLPRRSCGHEGGHRERHLAFAFDRVRRDAAFEVDRAVGHHRDAGGRGHLDVAPLQVAQSEPLLYRIDDAVADVHRVADGTLGVVKVGKRELRIAMAQRDDAGLADLAQGGRFLRSGGSRHDGTQGGKDQSGGDWHGARR